MEKIIDNENVEVVLKTKHLFKVLTIVRKTGVLDDMKELFTSKTASKVGETELGVIIVMGIIEGLEKVEQEVYDLLADLSETTPEVIENQDLDKTLSALMSIVNSKSVQGFLKTATA